MPDVLGFDHVYLAVSDLAASERFYDAALLGVLGFRKSRFDFGGEPHLQYFNRHFGIVLRPARAANPHDPYAPGLHHLCLRVDGADDVRATAEGLRARGIAASEATLHPDYAPDYVATFFADPDGIRLEVTNYRDERRARHDRWEDASTPSPASP